MAKEVQKNCVAYTLAGRQNLVYNKSQVTYETVTIINIIDSA